MIEDSQINNKKGVQLKTIRFLLYTFYYLYFTEPMLCKLFLLYAERRLLHLLEMQTVIKQAICVSVLQMCCNYENKQR